MKVIRTMTLQLRCTYLQIEIHQASWALLKCDFKLYLKRTDSKDFISEFLKYFKTQDVQRSANFVLSKSFKIGYAKISFSGKLVS